MSNTTDLERIDEYMKLQQFAGKVSDQVFDSWKAVVDQIKKELEITQSTCCECGEKSGEYHYCAECHEEIQGTLNTIC